MRDSIQMIKWCGCATLLFLMLTYISSVYSKVDFVLVSVVWLPKEFFLAVSSGIFASMLVVVFCEIRKYLSLKSEIENQLFNHNTTLFTAIKVLKVTIEDYITHKELVSDNLFDKNIEVIKGEIYFLQTVEYITFFKNKNSLSAEYELFREGLLNEQDVIQADARLKICINEIRIEFLKKQEEFLQEKFDKTYYDIEKPVYTSENPDILKLFQNILMSVDSLLDVVDNFNMSLDKHCNKRFKWNTLKEKLVQSRFKD